MNIDRVRHTPKEENSTIRGGEYDRRAPPDTEHPGAFAIGRGGSCSEEPVGGTGLSQRGPPEAGTDRSRWIAPTDSSKPADIQDPPQYPAGGGIVDTTQVLHGVLADLQDLVVQGHLPQ